MYVIGHAINMGYMKSLKLALLLIKDTSLRTFSQASIKPIISHNGLGLAKPAGRNIERHELAAGFASTLLYVVFIASLYGLNYTMKTSLNFWFKLFLSCAS